MCSRYSTQLIACMVRVDALYVRYLTKICALTQLLGYLNQHRKLRFDREYFFIFFIFIFILYFLFVSLGYISSPLRMYRIEFQYRHIPVHGVESLQTDFGYQGDRRCVNACTPHQLLRQFSIDCYRTYVPDTGYQWAPLHVVQGESPSGSVLRSMGYL